MKKHNFSAGPSILPEEVLEKSAKAVLSFDDGLSLIEISHRSKAFIDVMENARALAIELLGLEGIDHYFSLLVHYYNNTPHHSVVGVCCSCLSVR